MQIERIPTINRNIEILSLNHKAGTKASIVNALINKPNKGLFAPNLFKILQIIDQGGPRCFSLSYFSQQYHCSIFAWRCPFICFSCTNWVVFDCIILCKDSKQLIATSGFLIQSWCKNYAHLYVSCLNIRFLQHRSLKHKHLVEANVSQWTRTFLAI